MYLCVYLYSTLYCNMHIKQGGYEQGRRSDMKMDRKSAMYGEDSATEFRRGRSKKSYE